MGCEPTWTCAPYQMDARPRIGEHVAGPSRTPSSSPTQCSVPAPPLRRFPRHRSGDHGRAPAAGLHLDTARHATIVFDVSAVPATCSTSTWRTRSSGTTSASSSAAPFPSSSAHRRVERRSPEGDRKRRASSGSLAMFHVVGSTPEAPTSKRMRWPVPTDRHMITAADLAPPGIDSRPRPTRNSAIGLGHHYSVPEFARLIELLGDRRIHPDIHAYVNTGRSVAHELDLRGGAPGSPTPACNSSPTPAPTSRRSWPTSTERR